MDSITQAVLGATIGEAGFRRRLGGRAVALGALCGVLPDLDIAAGFIDQWATLTHHRGFSHSLLVLPLVAPVMGWVGYRWARRETPCRAWVHLALWALLTHPLLDLCTTYGTQLLWPVSKARFALDAVAIIDPFYTLPLLLALLLGRWPRMPARVSGRLAVGALAVTTAYLALGFVQSRRAVGLASAALARQDFAADAVRATPTLGNIWLWRIVARNEDGDLRVGYVSTWSPGPTHFDALERPDDPLVAAALRSEPGRTLAWFAGGMVSARVHHSADGAAVVLRDQRYGSVTRPCGGLFGLAVHFDRAGRFIRAGRAPPTRLVDWREELSARWHLLSGRGSGAPGPAPD